MSYTCPVCSRTSHHPEDEEHGYCGACHAYTRNTCPHCAGHRMVPRGPTQPGYGRPQPGPWRRWRCADCGGETDVDEP